jgi:hypothetical protein
VAGQAGETFLAQEHGQGIEAKGVALEGQLALAVIEGQVLLTQGDGPLADAVAGRGGAGSGLSLTFATGGVCLRKCLQIKASFLKVCTTAAASIHGQFVIRGDLRWRLRGQFQLQLRQ